MAYFNFSSLARCVSLSVTDVPLPPSLKAIKKRKESTDRKIGISLAMLPFPNLVRPFCGGIVYPIVEGRMALGGFVSAANETLDCFLSATTPFCFTSISAAANFDVVCVLPFRADVNVTTSEAGIGFGADFLVYSISYPRAEVKSACSFFGLGFLASIIS